MATRICQRVAMVEWYCLSLLWRHLSYSHHCLPAQDLGHDMSHHLQLPLDQSGQVPMLQTVILFDSKMTYLKVSAPDQVFRQSLQTG